MVCLCEGVSERKIRRAIDRGASSIAEVAASCHAGACCRGCHPTIEELLDEAAAAGVTPVRLRLA